MGALRRPAAADDLDDDERHNDHDDEANGPPGDEGSAGLADRWRRGNRTRSIGQEWNLPSGTLFVEGVIRVESMTGTATPDKGWRAGGPSITLRVD